MKNPPEIPEETKPEHQNRFFSLIHERRIQGILLEKLVYRWAAMNPSAFDGEPGPGYVGTESLDAALADRFAFIFTVPDWMELEETDQRAIADPADERPVGENPLRQFLAERHAKFAQLASQPDPKVIDYVRIAATAFNEAGIRISPRRGRQLARNILALQTVSELRPEKQCLLALRWSLPQRATSEQVEEAAVQAAHRVAWDTVFLHGAEKWIHDFHLEKRLGAKAEKLLQECPDKDTGSLAVTQLLATEARTRAVAFALALYPLAVRDSRVPIGAEGINELGLVANEALHVPGICLERERPVAKRLLLGPAYGRCMAVIQGLQGGRRERAAQLLCWLLLHPKDSAGVDPTALESEFNDCVTAAGRFEAQGG
jgi:MoxR-like ATPase